MSQAPVHLTPSTPPASQERALEAVIGHRMPQSAGMWAHQYAQQTAGREGRVVMAHLMRSRCDLRLFDQASRAASDAAAAPEADPLSFFKSMQSADEQVARWMIRIEDEGRPEALAALGMVDRWTLITSVDVHTCVGLYVLVKSLREAESLRLFRRIGVFVVGCGEREARACVTSANLLTTNLLRAPLEYAGHLHRPLPPSSSVLGGFDLERRQWPDVITRFKQLSQRRTAERGPALRLTEEAAKENER